GGEQTHGRPDHCSLFIIEPAFPVNVNFSRIESPPMLCMADLMPNEMVPTPGGKPGRSTAMALPHIGGRVDPVLVPLVDVDLAGLRCEHGDDVVSLWPKDFHDLDQPILDGFYPGVPGDQDGAPDASGGVD